MRVRHIVASRRSFWKQEKRQQALNVREPVPKNEQIFDQMRNSSVARARAYVGSPWVIDIG